MYNDLTDKLFNCLSPTANNLSMYTKAVLVVLIAGFYFCAAAPVESEAPQGEVHSIGALPSAPLLQLFHIHKPHLSHLIPHKISGTIHKGPVTIHGSVSIGHHHHH